jgi:hypothetical protein
MVARELGKYKLDLMGVQEVRWDKGGTERAEDYTFFYREGNDFILADCSKHRGISLLSTSYTILSNILLCRIIPCADELIGKHQYRFRCNRSTTDQMFGICQVLEKKWEYNGT